MDETVTVTDNTSPEVDTAAGDAGVAQDESNTEVAEHDLNVTIEDLMGLTSEDFAEFEDDARHTGMKPLHEWMKNVPEDVRKHFANLRADYTRKTQALAEKARELEVRESELAQRNEQLMNGDLAQRVKNIDTEAEYDLFDPDGMKNEIKRQAALMLKEMLEPAQQELELNQRKLQLQQFKAQNPEMTDPAYREPIVQLLKERPELKLEDAFYIVKAKVDSQKLSEERSRIADERSARRDVARKSSTGRSASVAKAPKFKNAIEAYNWHKSQQGK